MIKHHFKTQNLHLSRVGASLMAGETGDLTLKNKKIQNSKLKKKHDSSLNYYQNQILKTIM